MKFVFSACIKTLLVGFSISCIPVITANAAIKNLSTTTPYELFYPKGQLEGRIGKSLLITKPDGDIAVFDTMTGTTKHTISLADNQRLWSVASAASSSLGVISFQTTKNDSVLYSTYAFAEGDTTVWDGNKINGNWSEVYKGSEDADKEREQDYFSTWAVNANGDVMLHSNLRNRQILIKDIYSHLVANDAVNTDSNRTLKGGGTTTFNNNKNTSYLCMDDDATHLVAAHKTDSGNFSSLSIIARQDNKLNTIKTFELPDDATSLVAQCYGNGPDSFRLIVDLALAGQVALEGIPPRSIIDDTSSESKTSVSTVKVTNVKSNVMRILYDGNNEVRTTGGFIYAGDPSKHIKTPVAIDAYIDLKSTAGKSILSSMDYSRGIKLPGNPGAIIDYPLKGNAERLYCVFGQQGSDIYKSCYTAKLK